MTRYARFASLFFAGQFAGFLLGVLVLELSLRRAGATLYTQVRLVELDSLDKLASALLIPAILATALLAYQTLRTGPRWSNLAAVALLVFVLVVTIVVNLPINSDQLDWDVQSPPSDWHGVRDHWQIAHIIRTTAAVLAFAILTFTALPSSRRRTPRTRTIRNPK